MIVAGSIFAAGIFSWLGLHGSTFQAAVTRGVARFVAAVAPQPKPTVLLPVKFDKQDHALSCEVATLKMALAHRGVFIDESELISKIGFEPMWGDPQKAFVGNIDGKMFRDGYGVHWFPIARAGNDYRYAVAFEGFQISDLVAQLNEGNPIIIWGYLGSGNPKNWTTRDGKEIRGVSYEHTFVVTGYSGDEKTPDGFFLIDPIYGNVYYDRDKFLKRWDGFGRSGVVVY